MMMASPSSSIAAAHDVTAARRALCSAAFSPAAKTRIVVPSTVSQRRHTAPSVNFPTLSTGATAPLRRDAAAARASAAGAVIGPVTYDKTWSNPTGAVLTPLVESVVWAAERPFIWNDIDVGGKMAVVKLTDGSLWVHSPVDLDEPLKTQLATLGEVKHIVSPNYEHVKWAAQWKEAYPEATLYGSPGMMQKKPAIPWDVEVGAGNRAPKAWLGEIEVAFFDCETTPIVGGAFFNEVVFHHAPSGCLMVTDLFWNYPEGDAVPPGTRLWKLGMDRVYLPFYGMFMVSSRDAFGEAADRVLGWDFHAVLPCHGSFFDEGAKDIMRKHLTQIRTPCPWNRE